MSKITFDVLSVNNGIVEMRVEATRVMPGFALDQRARLRAIRAVGLENIPEEIVEDIMSGNIGMFTEIQDKDVVEERGAFKTVGYTVEVRI